VSQIIRVGPSRFINLATLGHVDVSDSADGLAAGERPPVATAYTLGGRVRLTGDDARELVRLLDAYSDTEELMRDVCHQEAQQLALDCGTFGGEAGVPPVNDLIARAERAREAKSAGIPMTDGGAAEGVSR
jgi:hypothetical protein